MRQVDSSDADGLNVSRHRLSKVPEITALFWVIKVLTTGMGETTSDFLAHSLNPLVAVALGGTFLLVAMVLQLRADRYRPWLYWFAIVMVSVFGTMVADVLHVGFGVPYLISTPFFAAVLAVIFVAWDKVEGTLSIHSIHTARREYFYWATVMATFALGTAAGDLTAVTFHLGYLASGILFLIVIAIPAISYRLGWMNAILAFWFAYVVTRPLGASFADWLAVPAARGGLDLGTGPVSLALTAIIVVLVAYVAKTHNDVEPIGRSGH